MLRFSKKKNIAILCHLCALPLNINHGAINSSGRCPQRTHTCVFVKNYKLRWAHRRWIGGERASAPTAHKLASAAQLRLEFSLRVVCIRRALLFVNQLCLALAVSFFIHIFILR